MRYIVLTPNIDGADGISALARLVVRAVGPDHTTVMTLNESRQSRTSAIAVDRIDCGGRNWQFVAATIAAAARTPHRTTVVTVHLHLLPAALAFKARGAATAAILCGIEAWNPLTRTQTLALRHVDALLAISRFTADRFRAAQPAFHNHDITVCHPGVEPMTRPSMHVPAPATVLIVGRMASVERYKGHDQMLEAWPDVRRAIPSAVLRVVGDGDDRPRLQQKAEALGLDAATEFVGRVDDARLAAEYERCHVFAMPSTDEGFGLAFVEAMRAGRPCIGVRGAAEEIVVDGETGYILGDRSPKLLAEAVVRLLRDPALADRMGAAGRCRFERQFTAEAFRDRFRAALPRASALVG